MIGAIDGPVGLHTDLYELRMAQSYLRHGMTGEATFSLYARASDRRPWLLTAGLDRALEILDNYRFGPRELALLSTLDVDADTRSWLADLEPVGELWAVPDGSVVLADEPILEMTAPLPLAQLLETTLLNVVHHDTLLATKAARVVLAAEGRAVVDFGFRRAHGLESGHRAARSSYLAGAAGTSNVEAGRRYDIPVFGTMAHSFVQAYDDELEAFRDFASDHAGTTLLVDTYDTAKGVEHAIEVATSTPIEAIRIDSEPLDELIRDARGRLDAAGLHEVRIIASGGLDEQRISELLQAGVPVDGFGVGSSLVTSSDKPALDIVYKLVAYEGLARAKYSPGKRTLPGAKQIFRLGSPADDVLDVRGSEHAGTALLSLAWKDGQRLVDPDLEQARSRAVGSLRTLPDSWRTVDGPDSPPAPRIGPALAELADEVEARERSR